MEQPERPYIFHHILIVSIILWSLDLYTMFKEFFWLGVFLYLSCNVRIPIEKDIISRFLLCFILHILSFCVLLYFYIIQTWTCKFGATGKFHCLRNKEKSAGWAGINVLDNPLHSVYSGSFLCASISEYHLHCNDKILLFKITVVCFPIA